jgi:hypothetical protein
MQDKVLVILLIVCSSSTSRVSSLTDDSTRINPEGCGLRYKDIQSREERFLSNKRSYQKDWGWHVLVSDKDGFSISGSLINSQWVLTTAKFAK